MKKLFAFALFTSLAFFAQAKGFQEGKHYEIVKAAPTQAPEVREYFSFYCPHCFKFEPLMTELKEQLPADTKLIKNHVDFMRNASKKMQNIMSKALATAEVLNVEESQVAAIFKYIHVHRGVFTSLRDVRNVFVLNGVDGDAFDKTFASDAVQQRFEQMKKHQETLSKSGALSSVPTVVVNGKYKVNTQSLDTDNFVKEYTQLVNYLLTLK